MANPIRILPITAAVRPFSGDETDYSATQFVRLCEDSMVNSSVNEDTDKIAFLKSHLQPGSRACSLIQASASTEPQVNTNYTAFLRNFLKICGEAEQPSLIKTLNADTASAQATSGVNDLFVTQVSAARIATDLMQCLQDTGWTDGIIMTHTNVGKFLEFFLHQLMLDGRTHSSTLPLESLTEDELHSFVQKFKTKLEEKGTECMSTTSVSAVKHKDADSEAPSSSATAVAKEMPKYSCFYCQKDGHAVGRCYRRMRDQRAQTSGKSAHSEDSSGASSKAAPSSSASRSAHTKGVKAKCVIHDSSSHTTEECYSVKKLKEQTDKARRGGTSPSGEAERETKSNPG